jgi:hypothetical protein
MARSIGWRLKMAFSPGRLYYQIRRPFLNGNGAILTSGPKHVKIKRPKGRISCHAKKIEI